MRRLETVADGLPLFGGAQLTLDDVGVSNLSGWYVKEWSRDEGRGARLLVLVGVTRGR